MYKVFLSLGSNQGNRVNNIEFAINKLGTHVAINHISRMYETQPWEMESNSAFINVVLSGTTSLTPLSLLQNIHSIESELGRLRENSTGYVDRPMDIDILTYGQLIYKDDLLEIPHPRMHLRRFVLVPLNEIGSDLIHPVLKSNILTILKNCKDNSSVTPL